MANGYWHRVLERRIDRRRALVATSSTAAAAAFLAACGGESGGGTTGKTKSELVADPVDTTNQAKRWGTLKERHSGDPVTLDPVNPVNPLNPPIARVYSTLIREKAGYLEPNKSEHVGDIAESWEHSPDRLQITMKLRPNVKWHNKAPVNGRTLDMDDVLFSYNRFADMGAIRALTVNSPTSPGAPVLSVTSTDSRTLVIKLKEPLVYALELFASYGSLSGGIVMVPKETGSSHDIRREMIGTGPYVMTEYATSQHFKFQRNNDYFDKDFTYFDAVDMPIVTEAVATLSQFKAGNIHFYAPGAENVLTVKREQPKILMYETDVTPATNVITFGQLPEGRSPFKDERVRQAFSMAWDRDLYIDTFYNVPALEDAGLPVETRWNSSLQAYWEGWWLDPKSKDFGPNAKYYQHDIAEAKKLLAAAGFPNGLTTISHCITGNQLGDLPKNAEVLDAFVREIGIDGKLDPIDYARDYIPVYRDGNGQYEGWAYHTVSGTTPIRISPVSALASEYWSKSGATFKGFSLTGRNDQAGDPELDRMIERARLEPDVERRRTLVNDIQRYLAKPMYGLIAPGGSSGFTMAWPALRNFQVYRGGPGVWRNYRTWLDESLPPFKDA